MKGSCLEISVYFWQVHEHLQASWLKDVDEDDEVVEHDGYDDEHKTSEEVTADVASLLDVDVLPLLVLLKL